MFTSSTEVLFHSGCLNARSRILSIEKLKNGLIAVFVDKTPFHPLDNHWPDQPADKGTLTINDEEVKLEDCLTAAFNKNTGEILIGQEANHIRRNDSNWYLLVAHIINGQVLNFDEELIGKIVELKVDANYRQALSEGHTSAHLAALALNKATNAFWRKEIERDSLGSFDLDRFAIQESKVMERSSKDIYRLGKSLKKKGFNSSEFFDNIDEVEKAINLALQKWLGFTLTVNITPEKSLLSDLRIWSCDFGDGTKAEIPCGGTHLLELRGNTYEIRVSLTSRREDNSFVMNTNFKKLLDD